MFSGWEMQTQFARLSGRGYNVLQPMSWDRRRVGEWPITRGFLVLTDATFVTI